MMEYLDAGRTIATYESMGGDHCFVRYGFVTVREEVPGWAPPIVEREIVEAVFVPADETMLARWVLAGLSADDVTLADIFGTRAIPFRLPNRERTATTHQFPAVRPSRWTAA